ncbi:HPr-rel-A system PqqD family peptide chaperone [Chitinimonas naiadis]
MALFSLDSSGRFLLHAWEEDALAFDTYSGDTHLLEPLAAALVRYLGQSECDLESLLAQLNQEFIFPEDQSPALAVDTALLNMRGIGLVRVTELEAR